MLSVIGLGILAMIFIVITIILVIATIVFGIIRIIKKKFKKVFVVLLIITILSGIFDFYIVKSIINKYKETTGKKEYYLYRDYENGCIKFSDNPAKQFFLSTYKEPDICSNDIREKLQTKDYANIKKLFSRDIIKNKSSSVDDAINILIDILQEGNINMDFEYSGEHSQLGVGAYKNIVIDCYITTTNNNYSVIFWYCCRNEVNSEKLGVDAIRIFDENFNILLDVT